jgi:hypothetical protein
VDHPEIATSLTPSVSRETSHPAHHSTAAHAAASILVEHGQQLRQRLPLRRLRLWVNHRMRLATHHRRLGLLLISDALGTGGASMS